MSTEADKKAFLAELSQLSNKYGVGIGGCGCCGSPFLTKHEKGSFGGYEESHVDDGRIGWNPEKE